MLQRRLAAGKRYPAEARSEHRQGVVLLHFVLDRQGDVLSADIARSSGSSALDREALDLVRRVAPLPPPPPEIAGQTVALAVPIEFSLF